MSNVYVAPRLRAHALCVVALLAILTVTARLPAAHAVFRIWDPVNFSVDWHNANNWDPPGVPTTNDNVQVSNPGVGAVLTADSQPVNSLVITAGGVFSNGHRLFVDDGDNGLLTVNGVGGNSANLNIVPLREIFEFEPFALRVDEARVLSAGTLSFSTSNGGDITAVVDVSLKIGTGGTLRVSGTGTTTVEFVHFPLCPCPDTPSLFVNNGTITVAQNSALHMTGRDARFKDFGLGGSGSLVDIQTDARLILDKLNTNSVRTSFGDLRFAGAMNVRAGAVVELSEASPFGSIGEINLDGGRLSGEVFLNAVGAGSAGVIAGEGAITITQFVNFSTARITGNHSMTFQSLTNQGQITGQHSIDTRFLNNAGGTIAAVDGLILINADTVSVGRASNSAEVPGVLSAVDGDIELRNVSEGVVGKLNVDDPAGGEVRVATGHEFRLTDSLLTFESGGLAHFAGGGTFDAADSQLAFQSCSTLQYSGGGTLVGGGTFGAILGRGLDFEEGSLIQVDCCGEARLENASTFDNVRLGGDVILDDDLRLVRAIVVQNTSTFAGNGSLFVDATGSQFVENGTTIAVDVVNEGRINIESGQGTGEVRVAAKYTQTSSGTLDIHLNNVVANQFDALLVDGNAVLDGTLNVILTPQFDAVVGNTFTIVSSTFGLVSGNFAVEVLPVFDNLTLEVVYNPRGVVLEVVEAPAFPADLDVDRDVDLDDAALFIACLTGPDLPYDPLNLPTGCELAPDAEGFIAADLDRDGDVDLFDFGDLPSCFNGAEQPPEPGCGSAGAEQ